MRSAYSIVSYTILAQGHLRADSDTHLSFTCAYFAHSGKCLSVENRYSVVNTTIKLILRASRNYTRI
jgi:hypothetical protein